MTHLEIRRIFTDFFISKGHKLVPSSSLVPEDDPSVLLTTAGMQQFKPYLAGEKDILKDFGTRRLTSIQKAFRTVDIDEVGDQSHLTFFEMLGNFSIGDYQKREAIEFAWELLTERFKIDPKRLYATVFEGEGTVPEDTEAAQIWREVAGSGIRIEKYSRADNFWGPTGHSGPCGPCSEIMYIFADGTELELWNLVFMEFFQDETGNLQPLKQKNIDTGMGLERLAWVLQGKASIFEADLFAPLIKIGEELAQVGRRKQDIASLRILADHARAAAFLAADGVVPSNTERGYVLRRVIRRAVRHGQLLDINGLFLNQLVEKVIEMYGGIYHNLRENQNTILEIVEGEERKFGQTLKRGLKELEKRFKGQGSDSKITGEQAFELYDTYGFPLDLTKEIAKERGFSVDTNGFERALKEQQERSRQAAKFKEPELGPAVAANHTATHLLNQALREVLGPDVHQAGQDLTAERLRFDFTFDRKLTEEELARVEGIVNEWVKKDVPVEVVETTYEEAVKEGAQALFTEKYENVDRVTMYKIDDFSKELCGGPHVGSTGEIKNFKITRQDNVGQGVRRIYAVTGS
jgi:alanyl-tRNA synthetase